MKALTITMQIAALGLLCLIGYNTSVGKTLPVHHPSWMSCDGQLSRALFYSTLLKQSNGFEEVASKVKQAGTIAEIDRLVADATNIDASRTQWFESVSETGKCQAQVFLKHPDKDDNNTAYIGFEVSGFAEADRGLVGSLTGGHVLQSIRLDIIDGIKWFRD